MKTFSSAIVLASVLTSLLPAQMLDAVVSPNPAPIGAPVTITVRARPSTGLYTPAGCLIQAIRSGTQTGPNVALFACTLVPVAIPPCGGTAARMQTWNQQGTAGQVPAGSYWIEVAWTPAPFGTQTREYFELKIDDAVPGPALTGTSPAMLGSIFPMQLAAPARAGDAYIAAVSASSNTGFTPLPGVFVGLDYDALLLLSLDPAWSGIFQNFLGQLDASGNATLTIAVPPDPALSCLPLRAQAVISPVATSLPIELSNVLSFYLQ